MPIVFLKQTTPDEPQERLYSFPRDISDHHTIKIPSLNPQKFLDVILNDSLKITCLFH